MRSYYPLYSGSSRFLMRCFEQTHVQQKMLSEMVCEDSLPKVKFAKIFIFEQAYSTLIFQLLLLQFFSLRNGYPTRKRGFARFKSFISGR
jgi:hypothetical protein